MALTVQQITNLSTKERVKEAFKELRRQGFGARMGIPWSARTKFLTDYDRFVYYEDWQKYHFNADGSLQGQLYCSYKDPEGQLKEVLNSFGLVTDNLIHSSGSFYITATSDITIKPLLPRKEQYAVTYTID